jgi:hypothetical protein
VKLRKAAVLVVMAVASFAAGYFVAWGVLLLGWPSEPRETPVVHQGYSLPYPAGDWRGWPETVDNWH